ncbi:MAG: hypothetical protein ACXVIG_08405, partial [Halobacteriota archaeon]
PSANGDTYPLMRPFESYELTGTPSATTLPASATASLAQGISSPVAAVSMIPSLTMTSLVFGTLGLGIGLGIGTPLVAALGIAYLVSMLT